MTRGAQPSAGASTFVGRNGADPSRMCPATGSGERLLQRPGACASHEVSCSAYRSSVAVRRPVRRRRCRVPRACYSSAVPDVRHVWSHSSSRVGIGWLSAGLLRDLLASREEERLIAPAVEAVGRTRVRVGTTEVAVVLGAVNLLFLAFVSSRSGTCSADRASWSPGFTSRTPSTPATVSSSSSPRRCSSCRCCSVRMRSRPRLRAVRWLSGSLLVLVLVVMASALQRMALYQREYGLTELRIYATGIILWLGCVFVWLG